MPGVNPGPASSTQANSVATMGAAPASPAFGISNTEIYNANYQNTARLRAALGGVTAGNGTCKLAFIGDSTTMGAYANGVIYAGNRTLSFPSSVARLLDRSGIPAQADSFWGNNGAGTTAAEYTGYDPRIAVATSWAPFTAPLSIAKVPWRSTTTTDSLSFTPVLAFDTIDVYYMRASGNGTFTVNVDGGAALATQSMSGTSAFLKLTITGVALATHVINIQLSVAGSGGFIHAVAVRDSTTPRVEVYNWGWSGSSSVDWAENVDPAFGPLPAMAVVAPNCTFIDLTINDIRQIKPNTIEQYKANIQRLITTALVSGNVVLMTGNPTALQAQDDPVTIAWHAQLYALADSNNVPLIDIYKKWKSYQAVASLGYYVEPAPQLHPSAAGYADIASSVVKLLTI